MPQMAPMNWLSLYLYFILMFIIIIIFNYYMCMYNFPSFSTTKYLIKMNNWKW